MSEQNTVYFYLCPECGYYTERTGEPVSGAHVCSAIEDQ